MRKCEVYRAIALRVCAVKVEHDHFTFAVVILLSHFARDAPWAKTETVIVNVVLEEDWFVWDGGRNELAYGDAVAFKELVKGGAISIRAEALAHFNGATSAYPGSRDKGMKITLCEIRLPRVPLDDLSQMSDGMVLRIKSRAFTLKTALLGWPRV